MSYFNNKTIWITGASSGIGEALAVHLSKLNANLILTARRKDELERVKNRCGNSNVHIFPCDLENIDNIDELSNKVHTQFNQIDILINNAGIARDNLMLRMSEEDWSEVINVHLTGQFKLMKNFLRGMLKNKWGRIINISSAAAASITTLSDNGFKLKPIFRTPYLCFR